MNLDKQRKELEQLKRQYNKTLDKQLVNKIKRLTRMFSLIDKNMEVKM